MTWKHYTPTAEQPWGLARVRHLHRRAGYGATWSELQRDIQDGPEPSIARVLAGTSRMDGGRENFESMSEIIGNSAAGSTDNNRLIAWWLYRILFSPHSLQEKLTLLWHNHFATSNLKVSDTLLMFHQNRKLRDHALGKFGDLLRATLQDPAMMYWLDANSNRAGHPNENLARELLELFTMGVGNYTEQDVKETARSLTGWRVKRDRVEFQAQNHDSGDKTILGQTASFDMESLVSLLLDQEATSRRLAWRLCSAFLGEGVADTAAISSLAAGLRANGLGIAWGVETILRSELFFSNSNIATRVSSPVEFTTNTVRALELLEQPPSTLILAEWCARLGQRLFYPPNVAGWPGGRDWLNTRTIVGRSNFATALVAGELHPRTDVGPVIEKLLRKHEVPADQAAAFLSDLLLSTPRQHSGTARQHSGTARQHSGTALPSAADHVTRILSQPEAVLI